VTNGTTAEGAHQPRGQTGCRSFHPLQIEGVERGSRGGLEGVQRGSRGAHQPRRLYWLSLVNTDFMASRDSNTLCGPQPRHGKKLYAVRCKKLYKHAVKHAVKYAIQYKKLFDVKVLNYHSPDLRCNNYTAATMVSTHLSVRHTSQALQRSEKTRRFLQAHCVLSHTNSKTLV
jgi:hypothetical protein